ncbi:uncharacterized protein [Nicotiana sylvestris]|uniref:uncharacterized protein n=1 Tax=Nicotiana sylvestris TaxID=4096 RepID=UPI00388CA9CC
MRETQDDDRSSKAKIGGYSFNVSTSELVVVLRRMRDKVRWPKEMRSNPKRRNPDFWCEFHNDHGHKMADCRLLQGEVEHLLKQGYLTELFSEKGKQAYMKNRQEPSKLPSPKRKVNVISGGEEINGVTYTTSKKVSKITVAHGKRVRQVLEEDSITFDDTDTDGSSVNIILLRVVNEMQADTQGIPPEVMTHKLNKDPPYPPVKQKKRKQGSFKNQVIQDEVQKLLKIRSIREHIDQLIDATAGHGLLSFLDAYSGYNQIKMDPLDEEKTSFITDRGTYCYKAMPFGLKNVGATYQTLILRKINMKLNPEKCAFGVSSGMRIVLVPSTGETIRQAIKCHSITNNEAEYGAVLAGLELARELRIKQIPREENVEADVLANLVSAAEVTNDENTYVIHLFHSVLDQDKNEVNYNNLTWDWRNEIVNLLQYGILPEDKKKAQALHKKATRYCLNHGNLYRKMFGGPLARCLGPSQTEYVMREIHEGHCGNHAGGRSLVKIMIRADYYWQKMEEDAENFVAKYDK